MKPQKASYYKALQIASAMTQTDISINGHIPRCVCEKCHDGRAFLECLKNRF